MKDFVSRDAGLFCADASLPASAYATGEVKDNFMGVPQEFAAELKLGVLVKI